MCVTTGSRGIRKKGRLRTRVEMMNQGSTGAAAIDHLLQLLRCGRSTGVLGVSAGEETFLRGKVNGNHVMYSACTHHLSWTSSE